MAIIYKAELNPSKAEMLTAWLDRRSEVPAGETAPVASYRFDDPAGIVGIEGHIVRRGEYFVHAPVTYRPEPLPGEQAHLVAEMEHSVLGHRYVYDARFDPVAVAVFQAALRGQAEPTQMDFYNADNTFDRSQPTSATIALVGPQAEQTSALDTVVVLDTHPTESESLVDVPVLRVSWADGAADAFIAR